MAMSLSLVVWAWACRGPPFCDDHSVEWSVSLVRYVPAAKSTTPLPEDEPRSRGFGLVPRPV